MSRRSSIEVAAFDPETARYVVLGGDGSFPDPRSAQAAGYLALRGPLTTAGALTLSPDGVVERPKPPLVISNVEGTEYRPPPPKPVPQRPRNARLIRRAR